jgi:O-antigen ligase
LVLTASRTGFLALGIVILNIVLRSRKKFLLIIIITLFSIIGFSSLSDLQKDRYLSIYRHDVRGGKTAQGRIDGDIQDFEVAMRKPIVGHGLGTSAEANAHATGNWQISHFLYTEILQELGFIGLIIFLFFIKSIISNFRKATKQVRENIRNNIYLLNMSRAMLVWFWMNLLYSFASYGLSSYEWYLFGGLSVVIYNLSNAKATDASLHQSYS